MHSSSDLLLAVLVTIHSVVDGKYPNSGRLLPNWRPLFPVSKVPVEGI